MARSTRGGTKAVGRSSGPRDGGELASAGTGCIGEDERLAAQAFASSANRRALANRFRSRSDARLCPRHGRFEVCRPAGIESPAILFWGQRLPLAYEPSGEDFLSPCLGEADVMRRVLPSAEFGRWLRS